jgi:broad specificity phosphatase PhoE
MKGVWQVKNPGLRPLAREAAQLRAGFAEVTFEWIPRERNKHADRLANEAMDAAAGIAPKAARSAPAAPTGRSWLPPSGPRTRLVLVRHGATEHSKALRLSGRNDLPLDPSGQAQAAALARRDFGRVDAVVTSPLRRARETAQPVAEALGLPLEVEDNLAELDFGIFEGLTFAEAQATYPEEFAQWSGSTEVAPPGGESFTAFARRVRRGRDAIVAAHPDATVLVVTHVTAVKMLVRAALEAPMEGIFRMHLDIGSVSTVDYLADGSASLRLFNDTSHLQERPQPMSW